MAAELALHAAVRIGHGQAAAAFQLIGASLEGGVFAEHVASVIESAGADREKKLQDIAEELERLLEMSALAEEGLNDAITYFEAIEAARGYCRNGEAKGVSRALRRSLRAGLCHAEEHTRLLRDLSRIVGTQLDHYA